MGVCPCDLLLPILQKDKNPTALTEGFLKRYLTIN